MKKIITIIAIAFCMHSNAQLITTVAGNGTGGYNADGIAATSSELNNPYSIALSTTGNLYIMDRGNKRVRMINTAGIISTVVGNGTAGSTGDGGQATAAELFDPKGLNLDAAGNLYIADGNSTIRMVNTAGIITTIAGNQSNTYAGDGGPATAAGLYTPFGVAVDATGNIYIADSYNGSIRMVNTAGIINTIAGNGTNGYGGDGGPATAAQLSYPQGLALDAAGNLYFSDQGNAVVRMIDPSGNINTIAGTVGTNGYTGDGGPATAAQFNAPSGLATDAAGNLYIADQGNNRIRMINTAGIISTIAGTGTAAYGGDGGLATVAKLKSPVELTVDANGNLYIADAGNNRIRKISCALSSVYTVVGIIMLILGLIIGFLITDFPKIEFDNTLKLYEVSNLFLTLCIAISIPFIVKKSIDDKRAIKTFLTDEVKEALKYLTKTKELINTCYSNGALTRQNKDTIIVDFDNLGLKINSLSEQLEISFKDESKVIMAELKETYLLYHRFVTGDELMREGYDKIDLGFHRDYKSHYNKLELQLKKLIHKFHCF